MSYKITIDGTDASSFLDQSDEIPINERNRDHTLVISTFEIDVSTSLSITPSLGDEVKIYQNTVTTTPSFIGYIAYIEEDEYTQMYTITVKHIIGLLEEYPVCWETINGLISSGSAVTEYNPNDDYGGEDFPTVNVLYLMKQLFSLTGYTLDISDLQTVSASTLVDTDDQSGSVSIYIKHLVMDENMIYAINQDVAAIYTVYDKDAEYRRNRITCFQLFSELCTAITPNLSAWTGCYITPSSATGYDLLHTTATTFAPSGGIVYKKVPKQIYGKQGGYAYELNFSMFRDYYKSTTPSNLVKFETRVKNDGKNNLNIWNNFVIGYQDLTDTSELKMYVLNDSPTDASATIFIQDAEPSGEGEASGDLWFDTGAAYQRKRYSGSAWILSDKHYLLPSVSLKHKINVIEDNFQSTEWITSADFTTLANISTNKVDLAGQTSLIRQEVAI